MDLAHLLLALAIFQAAVSLQLPAHLTLGFPSSAASPSNGKGATCVTGNVPITITSTNTKILLAEPANQTVVTELIQELYQADSVIVNQTNGGPSTVHGTFGIDATLCFPKQLEKAEQVRTVQVLTHGVGLEKSYWDIAAGYSYVDTAVAAGYATIAYNRLGVGNSDHPDAIQLVQSFADVEILHGIVAMVKSGHLGSKQFKNIIGVGHSYGSLVLLAQTAKYSKDVDAAVLTGFAYDASNLALTVLANNPAIASINNPAKFGNLSNGYIVHATPESIQLAFFRFPYFDQAIFENQVGAKQTYTIGQQFTLPAIYSPAPNFNGPVDVVVGQYDFPFCRGACYYPNDQAAATLSMLYPASGAGSQSFIVPKSGHFINAHYAAPQEFAQINMFLQQNRF